MLVENHSIPSAGDALESLIAAIEFEVPPIRDGVDVDRRLGILLDCAKKARAALPAYSDEPLQSEVFLRTDYGPLGKLTIILPQNNGGAEQFEADFEETLEYASRVMKRRKRARALARIATQAIEAGTATSGTGVVHESAVGNADAPKEADHAN